MAPTSAAGELAGVDQVGEASSSAIGAAPTSAAGSRWGQHPDLVASHHELGRRATRGLELG